MHPAAEQELLPWFAAQGSGVPAQAPAFQPQPAALEHASGATWLAQVAGCPEQAGAQLHPELLQLVAVANVGHASGTP